MMAGSHRYSVRPGLVGPLTQKQARRRAANQAQAAHRREQRRLAAICPTSLGQQHVWEPWDCACTFGCDCCSLSASCIHCGAKR